MSYFVYILANKERTVFFADITSNLRQRLKEHFFGNPNVADYTSKYNVIDLVFYKEFEKAQDATRQVNEIKNWGQGLKITFIKEFNPDLQALNKTIDPAWPPKRTKRRKL